MKKIKRAISLGSRIATAVFWIGAIILFALWIFRILMPFLDYAQFYQNFYGVSVGEALGIEYIINALFNNIFFILAVVFAIIGLPFGIITLRDR